MLHLQTSGKTSQQTAGLRSPDTIRSPWQRVTDDSNGLSGSHIWIHVPHQPPNSCVCSCDNLKHSSLVFLPSNHRDVTSSSSHDHTVHQVHAEPKIIMWELKSAYGLIPLRGAAPMMHWAAEGWTHCPRIPSYV